MNLDHLHPAVREKIDLPIEERISALRLPRWVGYPLAAQILQRLETLFALPQAPRMPNALLVGPTNNGKTSILERFCHLHPPSDNLMEDTVILPVLLVQAPPIPDETSFYDAILRCFATPIRPRDHARNKRFQVIHLMKQVGTKMLVIDEIQHLLAGDSRKQHGLLNVIKYLGNELRIPIVAAGVESAFNAIQVDPQISNRFAPMELPRWKMNDTYRRLLASFETVLPLKRPSLLAGRDLAEQILLMSEGVIGEMTMLLAEAGESAIRSGEDCITVRLLNQIRWVPPSQRRRKAEAFLS